MPPLINPKHEIVARNIANGMTQSRALEDAGMAADNPTVTITPEFRARVNELLIERERIEEEAKAATRAIVMSNRYQVLEPMKLEDITIEFLVNKLVDNARQATESKQFSASNKAYELVGKILGLFDDKGPSEEDKKKQEEEAARKARSLTLDQVNKALENSGFTGVIDLANADKEVMIDKLESKKKKKP